MRCQNFVRISMFLVVAAWAVVAAAAVRLPVVIGDNMVLQRGQPVPIWGWADADEKVTVTILGQTKSVRPDAKGKWMIRLDALDTGGPHIMTVIRKNTITLKNVLVGEVWLCSGQSNMGFNCGDPKISGEIKGVNYPQIRLTDGEKWNLCTADNLMGFSSVGYNFGLNLWKKLQVPIGLINVSCGCSSIEAWMTPDSLAANDFLVDANGCKLLAEMKAFQQFVSNYDHCSAAEKERVFLEHCKSKYSFAYQYLGKNGKPMTDKYNNICGTWELYKPAYQYNTRIASIVPFGIRGSYLVSGGNECRRLSIRTKTADID